ncbi:MAG: RNA 2',3'-cyclic phosphodiesterase [Bacteroidota bacterium]
MRTFIAVKILPTPRLIKSIVEIREELAKEKIKWAETHNLHLTLRFLGDTNPETAAIISKSLEKIKSQVPPFSFIIKGTGVFPGTRAPRVLWMGIEEFEGLEFLKKHIDPLMEARGLEQEDRPFKPHLTLGRIKHLGDREKLKALLQKHAQMFQKVMVNEFIYYESVLTPDGPVYKEIGKYRLAGNLS